MVLKEDSKLYRTCRLSVAVKKYCGIKMMKEVRFKSFAGPFKQILFKYFIQSPVGLVPKQTPESQRLTSNDDNNDDQSELSLEDRAIKFVLFSTCHTQRECH